MHALVLLDERGELRVVEVGEPVHIGRAPTNRLVLVDETVSAHHCVVWLDGAEVWLEDMGSSNGTWIGGARVTEPTVLSPGLEIRLGGPTGPQLRYRGPSVVRPTSALWLLEELGGAVRLPIRGERFRIGPSEQADLQVEAPGSGATLLLHPNGEVWLGIDGEDRPIEAGEAFEVGSRRFALVAPEVWRRSTVQSDPDLYDYRVLAGLGVSPWAEVRHRREDLTYRAEGDNRAVLLYLLARQRREDLAHPDCARTDAGWVTDDQMATGIWGRVQPATPSNSLNVLVHHVRKGAERAGLDPWFLEKRKRALRIRVAEVEVE